jgi:hypothetical protein
LLTFGQLWGQVAIEYGGLYLEAPATGGSSIAIEDTANLGGYQDNSLAKCWASIYSTAAHDAPEGQVRVVTGLSSSELSFVQGFSAAVEAGDIYRVWNGWPKMDLTQAARDGLFASWPDFYVLSHVSTLATVANQYEYAIPGTGKVVGVELAADANSETYRRLFNWEELGRQSTDAVPLVTRALVLPRSAYIEGRTLRLTLQTQVNVPIMDSGLINIDPFYESALLRFVGMYGAQLLHVRSYRRDPTKVREAATMRAELKDMALQHVQCMPLIAGHTIEEHAFL